MKRSIPGTWFNLFRQLYFPVAVFFRLSTIIIPELFALYTKLIASRITKHTAHSTKHKAHRTKHNQNFTPSSLFHAPSEPDSNKNSSFSRKIFNG